jgi:hypothetical protein
MSNLATIVNNILADSGIDDINVVVTTGSYANPSWITSLAWTKITGAPANIVTGTGTANEITYWTGSSTVGSLSTATYPSLTELSYVKGVTSSIQGQINSKAPNNSLFTDANALVTGGFFTGYFPTNIPSGQSSGDWGVLNAPMWGGNNASEKYTFQFAANLDGGTSVFVRKFRQFGTVLQDTWYTLLHSGNYNSYALPLTGGTLTGLLTSTISSGNNIILNKGTGPSIEFNKTNATAQSWQISTDPNFRIYNGTLASNALVFSADNNSATFGASVIAPSLDISGQSLLGIVKYAQTPYRVYRNLARIDNYNAGTGALAINTNIVWNGANMLTIQVKGYRYGNTPFDITVGCYAGEGQFYASGYITNSDGVFNGQLYFYRNASDKLVLVLGNTSTDYPIQLWVSEFKQGFNNQDISYADGWTITRITSLTGLTNGVTIPNASVTGGIFNGGSITGTTITGTSINGGSISGTSISGTSGTFTGTGSGTSNTIVKVINTTSANALINFENTLNGFAFGFSSTGAAGQRFVFINGAPTEVAYITSAGSGVFSSIVKTGGTSSQFLMADGSVSTGPAGGITGTGTTNYLPKFTGASTIGNSSLNDDGTSVAVGIALTSNTGNLQVGGTANTSLFTQQGTDTVRMGVRSSGRTGISIDSSNATFTNRMWYFDNIGLLGSLTIGRSGLDVLTFSNAGNLGLGFVPSATGGNAKSLQLTNYGTVSGNGNIGNISLASNAYESADNTWNRVNGTSAGLYQISFSGQHTWFYTAAGIANSAITWTQAMTLNASGNLGLGVTPSAWRDIFVAFQIGYTGSLYSLTVANATEQVNLASNYYQNSAGSELRVQAGYATRYQQASGEHRWSTAGTATAGSAISFTQAMTLNALGFLGIGTTPSYRLHVVTDAVAGRQNMSNISRNTANWVRFTNPQYSADASMGLILRVFPDSDSRQGAGIIASGGSNNACTNLDLFVTTSPDGLGGTSYSALNINGFSGAATFSGSLTATSGTFTSSVEGFGFRANNSSGFGSVGVGTEVGWTGTLGYIQAYNRSTSAYQPMKVDGSTVSLNINGTPVLSIAATTAATFSSTISASNFSGSSSGTNTGDQNLSGLAPNNASFGDANAPTTGGFFTGYNATNVPSGLSSLDMGLCNIPLWGGNNASERYTMQLFANLDGNENYYIRKFRFYGSVLQSTWRILLHSGNFGSYAVPLTGGTMSGQLTLSYSGARTFVTDGTNNMVMGLWDGANCRIETSGRPLYMVSYGGTISIGRSGFNSLVVDSTTTSYGSASMSSAGVFTGTGLDISNNSLLNKVKYTQSSYRVYRNLARFDNYNNGTGAIAVYTNIPWNAANMLTIQLKGYRYGDRPFDITVACYAGEGNFFSPGYFTNSANAIFPSYAWYKDANDKVVLILGNTAGTYGVQIWAAEYKQGFGGQDPTYADGWSIGKITTFTGLTNGVSIPEKTYTGGVFVGESVTASNITASGGGSGVFNSQIKAVNTGSGAALIEFSNTANGYCFGFASSGGQRFVWQNGAPTEIMSLNGSGQLTASAFFESSDSRIKIQLKDDLDYSAIANVKAKYYEKNGKIELGYFAQDFEYLLPSAVSKNENGMLNLSYREVHTAKIAYLEEKIIQLEQQLKNNKNEDN